MEPAAVEAREVNHYPCGFLMHPDAPWMGSSPDGIVYDPKGSLCLALLKVNAPMYQAMLTVHILRSVRAHKH